MELKSFKATLYEDGKINDNKLIDVYKKEDVDEYLQKYCIQWCIEDFEQQAMEKETNKIVSYDRTKFEDALINMINNHDASFGISWDTIDCYLDDECLIDDDVEIWCWPESQLLMELDGFEENCKLINDEYGLRYYGPSAFHVNKEWLADNTDNFTIQTHSND